ncbi:MAG TPA: tRNA (adenosine(37)-N6)-threonylcarbamoyltransferase complex dimerization subunit type 1 TsaB [Saprospiraceae bacterium]|nr:tRNA (adenosine(37)-N6)-threonylcarbamoyltransferase complex dimerization subunit type 1 TsaB [Saprospiraceae bacterium]
MSHFLCIETATEVCSVAIKRSDEQIFVEDNHIKNSHTECITLQVKSCLERAGLQLHQIQAIGISIGPGSYTGLRVGTSAAKGLALGAGIPLIELNTLQGIAETCRSAALENDIIIPMLDARRMEVYYSIFDHNIHSLLPISNMIVTDDCLDKYFSKGKIWVCGNGAWKIRNIKNSERIQVFESQCSAIHHFRECEARFKRKEFLDLAYFEPNYFKSPNITRPKNQKL